MENIIEEMELSETETLENQVEHWKSMYRSQCSKMGAYKTKVQREVLNREIIVKQKEEELKRKEDFIKNNNYDKLRKEKNEINDLRKEIEKRDNANREQLRLDFEVIKQSIKDELSKELIRWSEEYDIDNERSRGYMIGINKAKKIIDENMVFKLTTNSIAIDRIMEVKCLN